MPTPNIAGLDASRISGDRMPQSKHNLCNQAPIASAINQLPSEINVKKFCIIQIANAPLKKQHVAIVIEVAIMKPGATVEVHNRVDRSPRTQAGVIA